MAKTTSGGASAKKLSFPGPHAQLHQHMCWDVIKSRAVRNAFISFGSVSVRFSKKTAVSVRFQFYKTEPRFGSGSVRFRKIFSVYGVFNVNSNTSVTTSQGKTGLLTPF